MKFIGTVVMAALLPMITGCATGGTAVGTWQTGWDSGVLQVQEGSTNANKKKLVMRVKYEYLPYDDGTYLWRVPFEMWAEDHNKLGSGWHRVKELYSVGYTLHYTMQSLNYTAGDYKYVTGLPYYYLDLAEGYAPTSAHLPTFHFKTVTGTRSDGGSGLSRTWP